MGHGVQGHAVVVHLEERRDAGAQLALVRGPDDHDLHALLIARAALDAGEHPGGIALRGPVGLGGGGVEQVVRVHAEQQQQHRPHHGHILPAPFQPPGALRPVRQHEHRAVDQHEGILHQGRGVGVGAEHPHEVQPQGQQRDHAQAAHQPPGLPLQALAAHPGEEAGRPHRQGHQVQHHHPAGGKGVGRAGLEEEGGRLPIGREDEPGQLADGIAGAGRVHAQIGQQLQALHF